MRNPLDILADTAPMAHTTQEILQALADDGWHLVRFDRDVIDPRLEGWTLEHEKFAPPGSVRATRHERIRMTIYDTDPTTIFSEQSWSLQALHHYGDKVLRIGQQDLWRGLGRALGEHLGFITKEQSEDKS